MRLYEQYDCSAASVTDELGYLSREMLARWIDELEPGRRRVRRAPVDARTRRRAVVEYAAGTRTSRQVGEELGVSADVVRNWKHKMFPGDDKECAMGGDADEGRTPKAREDRHRDDGGRSPEGMRRERDELEIELEIIRCTKELLGRGGAQTRTTWPTVRGPVWCCIWPTGSA